MFRIDMKSDTVTLPPEPMKKAMCEAELGDDFYFEDPTVTRIEEKAARLLGKEAALLVLSGTMGNLVSLIAQAAPASECIVEADAHMFRSEAGGIARVVGIVPRRVPSNMGIMDPDVLEKQITKKSVLNGGTTVISLEQTHNGAGGVILPLDNMAATRALADKNGIKIHMDGARIFNAAVGLGVPVAQVAKYADSVTFCLSKGLACPLGALVCGTKEMVQSARYARQTIGGGMRQAGVIAGAGIWALDNMVGRLAEDHANAKKLAKLAIEAGFKVKLETVQTNMVRIDTTPFTADEFKAKMNAKDIDVLVAAPNVVRCVTHWGVTEAHIEEAGTAMKALKK
jgi:threonine aldolase